MAAAAVQIQLQLDADMSSNGNELATLQAQLQSQLEVTQNDIGAVREELESQRGTAEAGTIDLRSELLSAIEQRHTSCMDTIKSYGLATEQELRQVANRIVKEEMARTEADGEEMKVVEQLREQITQSIQGWHTAMDRFDEQHASTEKQRDEAEQKLRQELRHDMEGVVQSVNQVDQALRDVINDTRDEMHTKVDQGVAACEDRLQAQRESLERSAEQANLELGSRIDVVETSLERHIVSAKEEMNGMAGELTKLQDETKQTLLGFREYMDTELGAVGTQQDEMREELKGVIDVSFEEAKQDMEFAVSGAEERMREHVQEEVSGTASSTGLDIEAVRRELRLGLEGLSTELETCTTMKPEIHKLRIRITASEESAARLHQRVQKGLTEVRAELTSTAQSVDASSADLSTLIEQSNATLEETAAKTEALEQGSEQQQQQLTVLVAAQAKLSDTLQEAEQALRVNVTRVDERLARVHGRFSEVGTGLISIKSEVEKRMATMDPQIQALTSETATNMQAATGRLAAIETRLDSLRSDVEQGGARTAQRVSELAAVVADQQKKSSDQGDQREERVIAELAQLRGSTIPAIAEMQGQLAASATKADLATQLGRLRDELRQTGARIDTELAVALRGKLSASGASATPLPLARAAVRTTASEKPASSSEPPIFLRTATAATVPQAELSALGPESSAAAPAIEPPPRVLAPATPQPRSLEPTLAQAPPPVKEAPMSEPSAPDMPLEASYDSQHEAAVAPQPVEAPTGNEPN